MKTAVVVRLGGGLVRIRACFLFEDLVSLTEPFAFSSPVHMQ